MLGCVVLEPRLAKTASALGLGDSIPFGVEVYVITHAATKGAGGIFYDFDHRFSDLDVLLLSCRRWVLFRLSSVANSARGTRTGSDYKASAKRTSTKAPANTPWHVSTELRVDELPGL